MLRRADGTYTADAAEVDDIMHRAWDPVFMKYASASEPAWSTFNARFGAYIKRCPMHLEALTGECLRRALSKMHSGSSCGLTDGEFSS